MADYFTRFSCLLDVGSPDKAARALALFRELHAADHDVDDPDVAGLTLVRQDAPEGSILWIYDDEHGDPRRSSASCCALRTTSTSPACGGSPML